MRKNNDAKLFINLCVQKLNRESTLDCKDAQSVKEISYDCLVPNTPLSDSFVDLFCHRQWELLISVSPLWASHARLLPTSLRKAGNRCAQFN